MNTTQTDKATARPWHKNSNDHTAAITSDSGLHVADIDGYGATTETNRHNAALIVRAVNECDALNAVAESHESLRACVAGLIVAFENSGSEKDFARTIDKWINEARRFHGNSKVASTNLAAIREGKAVKG